MIGNVTILSELVPPGVGKKFELRPHNEVLTPLGHSCGKILVEHPCHLPGLLVKKKVVKRNT